MYTYSEVLKYIETIAFYMLIILRLIIWVMLLIAHCSLAHRLDIPLPVRPHKVSYKVSFEN